MAYLEVVGHGGGGGGGGGGAGYKYKVNLPSALPHHYYSVARITTQDNNLPIKTVLSSSQLCKRWLSYHR